MTRIDRDPSATRIAVTLGALVAVVMLGIWGASAVAGALDSGLKAPAVKATRIAPRPATSATAGAPATTTAEVRDTQAPAVPTKAAVAKAPAKPKKVATATVPKKSSAKYVVVIDPGHGGELSGTEPQGPHDSTPKARTNFGATGVDAHHTTEAAIALSVGLKLRPLLEAQGVKVVMTRTAPRAISNKDRAAIANKAHADLFLRLHCDGVDGATSIHGISMQVPAAAKQWAPIASSRKAGDIMLKALIDGTGAASRGVAPRSDLVGFNWCKVTTCLPEMGFLSNRAEADKLASDSYQSTLAKALATGTMSYLHTLR